MDKKKIIGVLSIACIIANSFAFVSCKSEKKALTAWTENPPMNLYCQAFPDYTGTLEEWLESLKGEIGHQGEKGEQGKDGVGIKSVEFINFSQKRKFMRYCCYQHCLVIRNTIIYIIIGIIGHIVIGICNKI